MTFYRLELNGNGYSLGQRQCPTFRMEFFLLESPNFIFYFFILDVVYFLLKLFVELEAYLVPIDHAITHRSDLILSLFFCLLGSFHLTTLVLYENDPRVKFEVKSIREEKQKGRK